MLACHRRPDPGGAIEVRAAQAVLVIKQRF
jgi:hypothetical protein